MGFFTPRYLKEGKGISKEDAEKRNYIETIIDKFFDLIKINLIYVACNIPALLLCLFLAIPLWFDVENLADYIVQLRSGNIIMVLWMVLPLFPLVLTGPFTAGLTYITRNFVKREHSFLFTDFIEHSKKNIKQTLIVNVIFFAVFYLYLSTLLFYFVTMQSVLVLALLIAIGIMLMSVPFYVYPMIVSFDMKLKDIIKNSWIFALAKLPQNLFFIIIIVLVHGLTIYFHGVWLFLMPIILISWTSFTMNYYSWHVISKYMMPEKKEEAIFSDESKEQEEK